jgi:hypothetical protein
MGFRDRSRHTTKMPFTPPPGLITEPVRMHRSVPFVFDRTGKSAFEIKPATIDMMKRRIDLSKAVEAAKDALSGIDMAGLRLRIIVLVDGSGSMSGIQELVKLMLVRALGFTLNVSPDQTAIMIAYGDSVSKPVTVSINNYQEAYQLINPDFGYTNMAEALDVATNMADGYNMATLIINISDGNPYGKANAVLNATNAYIRMSGRPIMAKNLAVKPVSFFSDVDDLPSQVEFEVERDSRGKPLLDIDGNAKPVLDGNGNLILVRNPHGIRLIDNVDSQTLDPRTATDKELARKLAAEIPTWLEMSANVGTITGVPGHEQTIFLN